MIATNKQRLASRWVMTGSLVAMLAVMLGAFGAHGLKNIYNEQQLSWFDTAYQYQMIHAVALILTGLLASASNTGKWLKPAAYSFLLGIVFFSGSLYLLSATQVRILGAVTPIGGVLFILGWICLALAGRDMYKGDSHE